MSNDNKKISKKQANSSRANGKGPASENKVTRLEDYLNEQYEFRFNIVTEETEYRKKGDDKFCSLGDRKTSEIRIELNKQGFTGFKMILDDLFKSPAYAHDFNPIKTYFEGLPEWNGNDYICELTDHVRLKNEVQRPWFREMFKKHLLRTVACSLRILPFNKHCFVLVGKQNDGKSYFIRFLCPPYLREYYKENPPLDHKDSILALGKNFIISLDELSTMDKVEANKIKSLFSQTDTKVRAHYAAKDTLQKRFASFYGTTNDPEFLNDVTGNVRWLVIEIDGIEHDHGGPNGYAKRVNIDNVWAQAYSLVMSGEKYELTSDEIREVERINKKYQKSTVEMDLVERYFTESVRGNDNTYALSATDVMIAIQKVSPGSLRMSLVGIGRALTGLGYEKHSIRLDNKNPTYRYMITSDNPEILNYLYSLPDYLATKRSAD